MEGNGATTGVEESVVCALKEGGTGFGSLGICVINKAVIILVDGVLAVDILQCDAGVEFLVGPDHRV